MESATIWQEEQERARKISPKFWQRHHGTASRNAARSILWPLTGLLACAVLLALPACIAPMPAMPDYPAHLASFYLLAGGAKSPILAHFYRVHWAWVPNLAAEVIVPFLAAILGLPGAAALFLASAVIFWVLGAGAVQWALYRRVGIAPLFASIFAYNANFMWGFINY